MRPSCSTSLFAATTILAVLPMGLLAQTKAPAPSPTISGRTAVSGTPQVWLDGRTARGAPSRVTGPIGQVLQQQTVIQAQLDATLDAVVFVALVDGGRVRCQMESEPFRLTAAAASGGAVLGRVAPLATGFPDVCLKNLGDESGAYYAAAVHPVPASAFATGAGKMLLNGIFDTAPKSIKLGRVLLVAVLPASASARKTAQTVPMMIGL